LDGIKFIVFGIMGKRKKKEGNVVAKKSKEKGKAKPKRKKRKKKKKMICQGLLWWEDRMPGNHLLSML